MGDAQTRHLQELTQKNRWCGWPPWRETDPMDGGAVGQIARKLGVGEEPVGYN